MDWTRVEWRTSSRSGSTSNCVEVGHGGEAVGVRDSKDRSGGQLEFTRPQWDLFLARLSSRRAAFLGLG